MMYGAHASADFSLGNAGHNKKLYAPGGPKTPWPKSSRKRKDGVGEETGLSEV